MTIDTSGRTAGRSQEGQKARDFRFQSRTRREIAFRGVEKDRKRQDKTTKMTPLHVVSKFLQACCVLCLYLITIIGVTYVFAAAGLYFLYFRPQFLPIAALYLAWMVVDQKKSKQGGRKVGVDYVGGLAVFRYSRDYYPISLEKTVDLDPCKNYIFGYHPHGFIPEGLVISFGTKVLDFQNKFPGITPHIGGHSLIFWSPIFREIALWLRVVDVGLESCRYVLTQMGPGHSMALIPGGAAESLDSSSSDYILTLNRRRQFIKMALETGSSLVPVFGFGQNDCFRIPSSLDYIRSYKTGCTKLEKWFNILLRNTLITFCGKYTFIPALPYNKPIAVVVGSPIHVERVTSPTNEQIKQLHAEYVRELKRLFEENCTKYNIAKDTGLIIQ